MMRNHWSNTLSCSVRCSLRTSANKSHFIEWFARFTAIFLP
jgi:hypothetical protein